LNDFPEARTHSGPLLLGVTTRFALLAYSLTSESSYVKIRPSKGFCWSRDVESAHFDCAIASR
jgi:hypothetical protein